MENLTQTSNINGRTSKKKYFDDLVIFEGDLAQKSKHFKGKT